MAEQPLRIEYVEARRVLLDVLTALEPHLDAVVLVGTQAVYLRTEGRIDPPSSAQARLALQGTRSCGSPGRWLRQALRDGHSRLSDPPGTFAS